MSLNLPTEIHLADFDDVSHRKSVCKQRIPRITQKKFSEDDSYFR